MLAYCFYFFLITFILLIVHCVSWRAFRWSSWDTELFPWSFKVCDFFSCFILGVLENTNILLKWFLHPLFEFIYRFVSCLAFLCPPEYTHGLLVSRSVDLTVSHHHQILWLLKWFIIKFYDCLLDLFLILVNLEKRCSISSTLFVFWRHLYFSLIVWLAWIELLLGWGILAWLFTCFYSFPR